MGSTGVSSGREDWEGSVSVSVSVKRSDSRAKGVFRNFSCWEEVGRHCLTIEANGSSSILLMVVKMKTK